MVACRAFRRRHESPRVALGIDQHGFALGHQQVAGVSQLHRHDDVEFQVALPAQPYPGARRPREPRRAGCRRHPGHGGLGSTRERLEERSPRSAGPARPVALARRRARLLAASLPLLALTGCRLRGAVRLHRRRRQSIAHLWRVLWYFAIPVAVIVYGLILWSVFRYRKRRKDDDDALRSRPGTTSGLEITYTLIPVAMVRPCSCSPYHDRAEGRRRRPAPVGDRERRRVPVAVAVHVSRSSDVTVVGTPDHAPVLDLPDRARPSEIVLRAEDVVHSFFVSDFLFQREAIPGVINTFDLTDSRRRGVGRGSARCTAGSTTRR